MIWIQVHSWPLDLNTTVHLIMELSIGAIVGVSYARNDLFIQFSDDFGVLLMGIIIQTD